MKIKKNLIYLQTTQFVDSGKTLSAALTSLRLKYVVYSLKL